MHMRSMQLWQLLAWYSKQPQNANAYAKTFVLNNITFSLWVKDQTILVWNKELYFKKSFMAPFYGWDSTALRLDPLWRGSLLFTTKTTEIPGTHFINFEGWKAESTFEPSSRSFDFLFLLMQHNQSLIRFLYFEFMFLTCSSLSIILFCN